MYAKLRAMGLISEILLAQWFPNAVPRSISLVSSRILLGRQSIGPCPRSGESETLGVGPSNLPWTSPPGDSDVHSNLRSHVEAKASHRSRLEPCPGFDYEPLPPAGLQRSLNGDAESTVPSSPGFSQPKQPRELPRSPPPLRPRLHSLPPIILEQHREKAARERKPWSIFSVHSTYSFRETTVGQVLFGALQMKRGIR